MERYTTRVQKGRKPRRVKERRICDKEGCKVRLTSYNTSRFCYTHLPPKRPRIRN